MFGLHYLALVAIILFWPAPACTQEPCGFFTCKPTHLYRGDTLRVTLSPPQKGCDMMILPGLSKPTIVSFTPLPEDKFAPMIPQEKFATLKHVDLLTTEAKGSPLIPNMKPNKPDALKPPELIFSESNDYAVLIGKNLRYGDDSAIFSTCNVEYSDRVRPKSAPRRK
jgi:hypothetical protein